MSNPDPLKWGPSALDGLTLVKADIGTGCYPWNLNPLDYLTFAREELEQEGSVRTNINTVCHAKRAIHAQVDFLLHNCGSSFRNASFPTKLGLLKKLGIVAPSILTKNNSVRNLVEHDYMEASREEAEEVVDVANLFVKATSSYTKPLPTALIFLTPDSTAALTIDCDWDKRQMSIVSSIKGRADYGASVIVSEDSELWLAWIAEILKYMQESENPYKKC